MGVFFEPYSADRCCLCGATENLTGEHKIKASALRAIFGNEQMVIGHFDGISDPRPAQGPKSQAFHFSARLCATCNSANTQAADREFERFHKEALKLLLAGGEPRMALDINRYSVGSEAYLNVFRYLAKLMACHIAESRGPRAIQIVDFATGKADLNPIMLNMDADPTYKEYSTLSGEHNYAAHGGLVVIFSKTTKLPTGFHTSLTLGPLRYVIFVKFGVMFALALKVFHHDFYKKCEGGFQEAIERPMSEYQLHKLGF